MKMRVLFAAWTPAVKVVVATTLLLAFVAGAIVIGRREGNEMEQNVASAATAEAAIPPIDAAQPAVTETATFALG